MHCSKCGMENPDGSSFCIKCGNNLKTENPILPALPGEKKGTFEQLDIISEEIEKLGFFYKLGFYIWGFSVLLFFSIYSLFIGPIIVYFLNKRRWPRNSLVKASLYSFIIYSIILLIFIPIGIISLIFLDGTDSNQYEVTEAISAKEKTAGRTISVNGSLVPGSDHWEVFNHTLTFKMTDGASTIDVVYRGEKPDIQCTYIQVRATGLFEGDTYKARDLWIYGNSKYYTTIEE